MKFRLEIQMGNDAMQNGRDVAEALRLAVEKVKLGCNGGIIKDENGNTVGDWGFTGAASDD